MHDGNQEWSWVSEDGIEHPVSESELSFALSSEEVAPYALVWKRGWSEWLPAMQVSELQWALPPGTSDAPRKPLISQSGSRRPPPLHRYAEYKQRAEDLKGGLTSPTDSVTSAPSASSPPPLVALRRETTPALASIAPAERVHLAFTREDEEEPTVQIDGEELERVRLESMGLSYEPERGSAPSSRPDAAWLPRSVSFTPPPPSPSSHAASSHVASSHSHPPPPQAHSAPQGFGSIPAPRALGSAPAFDARSLPQVTPNKQAGARSSRLPWLVVAAALAIGGLSAIWLRFVRVPPTSPRLVPTSTFAAEGPRSVGPRLCRIGQPGALLAEWAYPKIEPSFGFLANSQRIAIGYAQTSRYAVGLTLDPVTMRPDKVFSEFQSSPLLSVTPMTAGSHVTFRPTRAAATLQSATAIDAKVPFTFGWTREGFAIRRDTDAVDQVLWKNTFTTSNVPSVERLDNETFAFALRAGGERGSVLVGKLRESGAAVGELSSMNLPEGKIGLPSLRIGGRRVLVTLTLGASEARGDVYLADSKKPALPSAAQVLTNVTGGVYSPQAIELTENTFLLQFTRGEPGNQQVVAQVYDFARNKLGAELAVSPGGLDAHAGTLWLLGERALSLYMVRTDQAYALWATRLDCE